MAELNKFVLPVKNESTGVITNQEFDLPSGGGGDVSGKADKVSNATNGNFAGLDSNGNLTDSGSKPSDFLTQHQDISGKMDKVNPTGTGSFSLNRRANSTVGNNSFAEGNDTVASGAYSHAEGYTSNASGEASHAEGASTASGNYSHAEGLNTTASYNSSHSEGKYTQANGEGAHAEGHWTSASGTGAHAEGYGYNSTQKVVASGTGAHAEGWYTAASGNYSHAEGDQTTASGQSSHAEGSAVKAIGKYSHAGGEYVRAYRDRQFVHGGGGSAKFNYALPSNGFARFGIQPDYTDYSTNTTITDGQYGCSGCISAAATVTIELEPTGMYLLVCASFTASTGAGYGSTTRMITAAGSDTGTPANLSLGQTSNAPATISMAANNKLTIKNAATSRVTEFHLIRIL